MLRLSRTTLPHRRIDQSKKIITSEHYMFKKVQTSFFSTAVAKAGITAQVQAAQVLVDVEKWLKKEFGDGVQKFAIPSYVKNGIIHIAIKHPAIAEEVHNKEAALLHELRSMYPHEKLHSVRFIVSQE